MMAKLLSVGDELTSGQTVDTNSAYIAQQLAAKGIAVDEHRTVADIEAVIRDAIASIAGIVRSTDCHRGARADR